MCERGREREGGTWYNVSCVVTSTPSLPIPLHCCRLKACLRGVRGQREEREEREVSVEGLHCHPTFTVSKCRKCFGE